MKICHLYGPLTTMTRTFPSPGPLPPVLPPQSSSVDIHGAGNVEVEGPGGRSQPNGSRRRKD